MIGCGFLNFHKDQLWNNYLNNNFPIQDKDIIDEIVTKKGNGWHFIDPIGYLPYYCEKCMTLHNKYYLQMEKENEIYIPMFKCKYCNNILRSTSLKWENENDMSKYNIAELIIEEINGNIKILDKMNIMEYKIKCKKCGGINFKILGGYNWD
jgi:Zn finger protein HypA/HybF involved in hydrogenase expression